jgi:osmoprotectant transport system permease protein
VIELWRGIPPLLASHLELSLGALLLAFVIALPIAVAVAEHPRAAFATLTIAGVIQTVPGLALVALMVPALAAIGWLSPFGFSPAIIALTLYAILPILRNGVTGLRAVDPDAVEAARGMGMTRSQVLRIVQLPLAAPVIAAGVRTAAVWTVGAATLATPVGQPCLGNYIFTGLQTRNFTMLLVGVTAAIGLAVALDGLLALGERALAGRRKRRALVPLGVLAAFTVLAIAVLPRISAGAAGAAAPTTVTSEQAPIPRVRVGCKTFTEQYVLGELLRARLVAAGIDAELISSLGSTVAFDALVHGDLDAYVEYSGTLWTNEMKRPGGIPRWRVLAELIGWLAREHVRSLGSLGFENAYVLAVRRDTAERLGLHTLSDLAHHPELAIGGDYEFFGRTEWTAIQRTYGLGFARQATFDPALLYEAIVRRDIDVISAFSSDGRIAAYDLVVLADPAGALPPYDAMILLGPRVSDDPHIACALAFQVQVDQMRHANAMVDRDHASPAAAARWLSDQLPPAACH